MLPATTAPAHGRSPLLREVLGAAIRDERRRQARSLRSVASAGRISLGYLSEIERGRKEASSELLAAICDALGLGVADLLARVSVEFAAREQGGSRQARAA